MARKRRSAFEDFIDLVALLPWWFGVAGALLSYVILHAIALSPAESVVVGGKADAMIAQSLLRGLVTGGQYILPLGFLLGAGISFFKRLQRKKLLDETQAASDVKQAIRALSWRDFEKLVGEAFRRRGFHVTETPAGADGGVDLELSKDGELQLVQCKQWRAAKVGVGVVRELYGVMAARGVAKGYVITSGVFTAQASSFAEGMNIELIDGKALTDMIDLKPAREVASTSAREGGIPGVTEAPACPTCGSEMVMRQAKRGAHAGQSFWGCSQFPRCRGTRAVV